MPAFLAKNNIMRHGGTGLETHHEGAGVEGGTPGKLLLEDRPEHGAPKSMEDKLCRPRQPPCELLRITFLQRSRANGCGNDGHTLGHLVPTGPKQIGVSRHVHFHTKNGKRVTIFKLSDRQTGFPQDCSNHTRETFQGMFRRL